MALAIAPAFVTSASAKITEETHNKPNQGNPQGNGNGLTTAGVNPSGSAHHQDRTNKIRNFDKHRHKN